MLTLDDVNQYRGHRAIRTKAIIDCSRLLHMDGVTEFTCRQVAERMVEMARAHAVPTMSVAGMTRRFIAWGVWEKVGNARKNQVYRMADGHEHRLAPISDRLMSRHERMNS